jgi:hypothetical protein
MQAAAAAPALATPVCGMSDMAGLGGAPAHAGKAGDPGPRHAACSFCTAAANTPLPGALILAPIPTTFIFVTFVAPESHGPRPRLSGQPHVRGISSCGQPVT